MLLADAGADVTLWGRRTALTEQITQEHLNGDYLPGVTLPVSVRATTDPAQALDGADLVVLALPSQTLRAHLAGWRDLLPAAVPVVSLMKGIELGTSRRMSEVIIDAGAVEPGRVVVVSGPNLAREISMRQPAATMVAGADQAAAELVAHACATTYFRPYTGADVVGAEIGGAVKNVIALAVGMAEGLGLGDNSKASVITRGLAEMARLGESLGANPLTFSGLAGLGDLVATCMSPLSRNRTFGVRLGEGRSVAEVGAATQQTAEGVKSCLSILQLAQAQDVDMPIVASVVAVVHDGLAPAEMSRRLLSRARRAEQD